MVANLPTEDLYHSETPKGVSGVSLVFRRVTTQLKSVSDMMSQDE